jgi:hypothetical protein
MGLRRSGGARSRPAALRGLRAAIYTCTFRDYDNLLSPLAATPGCAHLHFSDRRAPLTPGWRFRPLPRAAAGRPTNEANRYCKILAHRVLPQVDLSVYVDGNILLRADLSPMMAEFLDSGADLALFRHEVPGWTVEDDITRALETGRVAPERRAAARRLLEDARAEGRAGLPVTSNAVLFRRHDRPALADLLDAWWQETARTAMRDQFTLPGLLAGSGLRVHYWPWHYRDPANGVFASVPHRGPAPRRWGVLSELQAASVTRARYSPFDRLIQRRLVGPARRALGRPDTPPDLLRPAARPQPEGE